MRISAADDRHVQSPRAVHALDPVELDVGGGRRPGDERERPPGPDRLLEPRDRLGNEAHDLILPDDADVKVRHEGQRPPALARPAVEHERARPRRCRRAQPVSAPSSPSSSRHRQGRVLDELDARRGPPLLREVGRDADPARARLAGDPRHRVRDLGLAHPVDGGPVLRHSLGEQGHDLVTLAFVLGAVVRGMSLGVASARAERMR